MTRNISNPPVLSSISVRRRMEHDATEIRDSRSAIVNTPKQLNKKNVCPINSFNNVSQFSSCHPISCRELLYSTQQVKTQRAWSPVSQGLLKAIPKGSNGTTHAKYNDYYKEWKRFEKIDQTRLFMFRLQKFPLTLVYIITCGPNIIITSFIFPLFIYLSLYRCKGQNCWKVQSLPKYNLAWAS